MTYSSIQTNNRSDNVFWAAITTIIVTSLVIVVNVNDSTLLKLPFLFTGVIILLALWGRNALRNGGEELLLTKIHWMLFLFLLLSLLSLSQAINTELAVRALVQQACYVVLFMAGFQSCAEERTRRWFRRAIIVLTAITCLVGVLQSLSPSLFGLTQVYGTRRVISTFGNATYFSAYLVFVIPILFSELLTAKKYSSRQMFLVVIFLTSLYLLIMTEARSSWIAFLVCGVLFIYLQFPSKNMRWAMVGIFIIAIIIILSLFPSVIEQRLQSIIDLSPTSSLMRRFVIYEGVWRAFLDAPLLGHGIGNFIVFLPVYRSPDYWMSQAEDVVPHAHNELLEVLSETGLLGFLCWGVLMYFLVRTLWRAIHTTSNTGRTLFIGYFCGLFAILVDNLGSMSLRTVPVAALFWFTFGVVLRQTEVPLRTISVQCSSVLKRFAIVPIVCAFIFLGWYVPKVYNDYQSDKAFLKGLQAYWRNDADASSHFQQSLTFNPNHTQARFYLSAQCVQRELYADALANLQLLLNNYPFYPKAKFLSAIARIELGDTATAVQEMNEAVRLSTDPQTLYYAASFEYRFNNVEREYQYVVTRLRNALLSRRTDYAQQGIQRLAELCVELHKERECQELLIALENTFSYDSVLISTLREAKSMIQR